MMESDDQVRKKINNHNNNNIELIIKKKQESISLQHIPKNFKVLYSFAGYKRTIDNTRMTADKILNLYLTETQKTRFITAKNLIKHMIDSAAGPR
jgi:hypothetical protein